MDHYFKSSGSIHYSPNLLGNSVSRWWVVLWCDVEISKYYRHLYHIHHYKCRKIQKPAWNSHITIVRDEEPSNKEVWQLHQNRIVEFTYSPIAETDGQYWWLPVQSEDLLDLREDLGLVRQPLYPLHLSFGLEDGL